VEQKDQPERAGCLAWLSNASRLLLIPSLAVFTALVLSAFFVVLANTEVLAAWGTFFQAPGRALSMTAQHVGDAYSAMLDGSIGKPGEIVRGIGTLIQTGDSEAALDAFNSISESLVISVPFIFAGLSVALGFKAGLFNIGAEGQLFMGAIASVWIGYTLVGVPWFIHVPLAILAGALGGALWGAVPGALKAWTGAHEVVTTIMMNYIAFRLSDFLLTGPMQRSGFNPVTPQIEPSAYLPKLFPPLRFHTGFFVALIVAALVYWLMWKTTIGFELRTVGANPDAARYAGISISRNFILAMALSGSLAGLGGAVQVLGIDHFVAQAFSAGYGFDSIALALLGNSHPAGVVMAALLWGFMRSGAIRMQSLARIPVDIFQIISGMMIVFVAAPALIRRLYRMREDREAGEVVFTRGWGG
jgi:simple sugar transport system permease protein